MPRPRQHGTGNTVLVPIPFLSLSVIVVLPLSVAVALGEQPGGMGLPSILTASREVGFKPRNRRIAGATCMVSTELVIVCVYRIPQDRGFSMRIDSEDSVSGLQFKWQAE
jgi:hypothetical protein